MVGKSRKRLNYAVDMDEDFPAPNLTPAQLKRLAQETEKKRLLAESSTTNFSILRGYTSTNNVGKKSSMRSLLSASSTSSRSHRSLKSEKMNKSKTRKLSFGKKKNGNSETNTITTVTEEGGDDDEQVAQLNESTHSENGNTESSSDKQEKEKKSIGRLVDMAKGGVSESQPPGMHSENSSLTSASDEQSDESDESDESDSHADMEDNLDDASVDKESQAGSQTSKKSLDTYKTKNTQNGPDTLKPEKSKKLFQLNAKQTKIAIIAIVVIAVIIVSITVAMTVGGLKGLREEVMQESYQTNNRTSMPTIYRTMYPTAGPKSLRDSSNKIIPTMTPSSNLKTTLLPIATVPNRKRGSSSTISPTSIETLMPSSSPSFSVNDEPSIKQHTLLTSQPVSFNVYSKENPSVSPSVSTKSQKPTTSIITTKNIDVPATQSSTDKKSITSDKIDTERNKTWNITATVLTPFFDEYSKRHSYGISQSYDGSRMAISMPFANNSIGVVVIYDYDQNEWVEIITLRGLFKRDIFGYSMSLSSDGKAIAIGGNGQNRNGYVKVYSETNSGIWEQMGNNLQMLSDGARGANFGFSISLARGGKFIAVGAPFASRNGLSSCGRVEFFSFNELNGQWSSFGDGFDGKSKNDWFGFSVDLAGKYLIVGAPKSSYVRVYRMQENNVTNWDLFGEDIHGKQESDYFGQTVSISDDGNRICIGAPMNSEIGSRSGVVYVYDNFNDSYFEESGGYIFGSENSELGKIISLSGDGEKIVVGGSEARLFTLQAGVWKGTRLDVEKNIEDVVVNISSDGSKIAVIAQPGEAISFS